MRPQARTAPFIALAWAAAAGAQTPVCNIPAGLDIAPAVGAYPQWAGQAATPCTFYTRFTQSTQMWAAGVVKHTYPPDTRQTRLQFHVDYTGAQISLIRSVGLVSWASMQPPAVGPSRLVQVYLGGVPGVAGERRLTIQYPNADNTGVEFQYLGLGTANAFTLTLELQTGANGYLSYWLDSPHTAAPTGRIPAAGYLDWSRHDALGGLSLGIFSGSGAFLVDNLNIDLVYTELVAEDLIFRSALE